MMGSPSATFLLEHTGWRGLLVEGGLLTLAVAAVPLSIAISEFFLALALGARVLHSISGGAELRLPRAFWMWLTLAISVAISWVLSPDRHAGWSEIRRLFLVGVLFYVMPALKNYVAAWKGVFVTSSFGSLFLLGDLTRRFFHYRRELAAGGPVSFYLRTGGFLHNWMVFGTVEIIVFAGLLSFWSHYPAERRRWWPALLLNCLAAIFSLTRMVWVVCLLLIGIDMAWQRSRWVWATPLLPVALFLIVPGIVRMRVTESLDPNYYSNAERIEMLRVGWRIIQEKPLTGIGPGRVEQLYSSYLKAGEPLPAYHGHLHNNLVQFAATLGLPIAAVAFMLVVVLFSDLGRKWKSAASTKDAFLCRTAIYALIGFLIAGLFDYTYGHSLALMILAFAVLPALQTSGHAAGVPEGSR